MRKYLLVFLVILSGIGFSLETSINVVPMRYVPYPAEPGQYLDLWIQVENRGSVDAKDFTFILEPDYPFSLYKGENATKYVGTLRIYEPIVIKYKLYVDENSVEGWNDLKYKYKIGETWVEGKTKIYISHKPQIEITAASPYEIEIGKKTDILLSVKNVGHAEARNVRVKFDTSSTNLKIVGTDTRYLDFISVGEEKTVDFKVVAETENSGVELVPVLITYEDINGSESSYTYYVGIDVSGEPEIKVLLRSATPEPFKFGTSDIELEIINVGPVTAKFVSVNASTPAGIISRNEYYIGDLDSDDFDIVDFRISFGDVSGKQPIYVTVKYKTPEYESREETKIIYFNVLKTQQKKSSRPIWIVLITLVVLVFFFLKKRK